MIDTITRYLRTSNSNPMIKATSSTTTISKSLVINDPYVLECIAQDEGLDPIGFLRREIFAIHQRKDAERDGQ